ncbi:hypothetical protein RCJ22_15640 [Vibrio sp. FNV 38]|nr:hypothetical protein [Vibrio sp. FNV 38]
MKKLLTIAALSMATNVYALPTESSSIGTGFDEQVACAAMASYFSEGIANMHWDAIPEELQENYTAVYHWYRGRYFGLNEAKDKSTYAYAQEVYLLNKCFALDEVKN